MFQQIMGRRKLQQEARLGSGHPYFWVPIFDDYTQICHLQKQYDQSYWKIKIFVENDTKLSGKVFEDIWRYLQRELVCARDDSTFDGSITIEVKLDRGGFSCTILSAEEDVVKRRTLFCQYIDEMVTALDQYLLLNGIQYKPIALLSESIHTMKKIKNDAVA